MLTIDVGVAIDVEVANDVDLVAPLMFFCFCYHDCHIYMLQLLFSSPLMSNSHFSFSIRKGPLGAMGNPGPPGLQGRRVSYF